MRVDSTNIGETIRLLHTARNLPGAEMAEKIGISISPIWKRLNQAPEGREWIRIRKF